MSNKLEPWQKLYKKRVSDSTNKELLKLLIDAAQDAEYHKPARFHLDVAVSETLERLSSEKNQIQEGSM